MDKKTKLIVIILAILTVISGMFAFQINNEKQALIKRYTKEIREVLAKNEQLLGKLAQSEQGRKKIQNALDLAMKDINDITLERNKWEKKYSVFATEKEQLLEKISVLSEALKKKPKTIAGIGAAPDSGTAEKFVIGEEEGYWSNIIKEKAALELKLNNLNEELTDIKLEFEQTRKERQNLGLELSKLEQFKDDLQRQLEYNEKLANNLSNDLAREVNDKQFLLEQFNNIKRENNSLRTQTKELVMTKLALEKGLTKLRKEKTALDNRLFETEQILGDRISDILQLKDDLEDTRLGAIDITSSVANAVELPPIVVRTQGEKARDSAAKGEMTGRIVSINEENNFVIIDLGKNSGTQIKDRFNVYRGSNQIATIEVMQLRKDISAADIVKKQGKIQVGDIVK